MSRKKVRTDGPWRLGLGAGMNEYRGESEFDELVVGDWLHIERMHHDHYWMCVGGRNVDVKFDRLGRVEKVQVSP